MEQHRKLHAKEVFNNADREQAEEVFRYVPPVNRNSRVVWKRRQKVDGEKEFTHHVPRQHHLRGFGKIGSVSKNTKQDYSNLDGNSLSPTTSPLPAAQVQDVIAEKI